MSELLTLRPAPVLRADPDQRPIARRPGPVLQARVDRLSTFCILFSGYLFLHQAMIYYEWLPLDGFMNAVGAFVFVAAAAAILFSRSLWLFSLAVGSAALYKLLGLPNLGNHLFLTLLMSLTILVVLARHGVRALLRGEPMDRSTFYEEMTALLCLELLVMYLWTVVHKLNWDYFNPSVSCGVAMYYDIARFTPLPVFPTGTWVQWPSLLGALVLEATIPLLLVFRRTRMAGVGLGLLYHFLLSLHPNKYVYSFSAMLYALYFLFLQDDVTLQLLAWWQKAKAAVVKWLRDRLGKVLLAGAGLGVFALVAGLIAAGAATRERVMVVHRWAWTVLAGVIIVTFFAAVRKRRGGSVSPPFARLAARALTALAVLPFLVFLNGLCPYVGLKTGTSFAMFSNIRTENGRNNHMFLPTSLRVAGFQDDVVEIIDSTDPALRALRDEGKGMVYFKFRLKLSKITDPSFSVTFTRGGREHTLTKAGHGSHEVFQPVPWLAGKLLHFRDIQLGTGPQRCVH